MPRSVMINDKYSVSVHTWRSSGPYFPAFELNRDQKNFEYGQLSRNDKFTIQLKTQLHSHDLPQNSQFSRGFSG